MFRHISSPLLASGIYPNAKEWTEAVACYEAVRKHVATRPQFAIRNPMVSLVAIGDGSTPRAAAMFSTRSIWQCYSVDPHMKWRNVRPRLERLVPVRGDIHDLCLAVPAQGSIVVVACHSHADLNAAVVRLSQICGRDRMAVVAMPCCVPQHIDGWEPAVEYTDWSCWSEHRNVKVWTPV
jgi:hypothetical protein